MPKEEKLPSSIPNKENESKKLKEPVQLGRSPVVNPDSRLDRGYEDPVPIRDKIRVLPPEIKEQIKQLKTASSNGISDEDKFAIYEYLERLTQDGEEFDEATRKTYENLWPV